MSGFYSIKKVVDSIPLIPREIAVAEFGLDRTHNFHLVEYLEGSFISTGVAYG